MANFPANDSGHLTIVSLHRSSGHCRSKLRKVGAGIGLPAGALLFLVPFIFAQNSPRVTNVEPASGKVNESVTLTGTDLGKDSVSAVFLSDGTNDYKATVLEQAGEKIIIKVPEVKSGGYNISIRQVDRIFIEPFRLTVLQPTPPPKAMRSAPPPSQAKPPVVPATFYGYVTDAHTGTRRAFFIEGEDNIYVLAVGEILLGRFRLVQIGSDTAELEEISSGRRATLTMEGSPP